MKLIAAGLALLLGLGFFSPDNQTSFIPSGTAAADSGKQLYTTYCLSCHQVSGKGVPSLNPPLAGSSWVTGDKQRLIRVVLNGLEGEDIDGETYNNVMPGHDFLTDQQLSEVLTYIRSSFGNKADAVTAAEVKAVRSAGK